jgi:hypothetical protein
LIDQLVRFKQLLKPEIAEKLGGETLDFDTPQLLTDDFNPIVEQARGLLALLVERGTGHLSQDQVEMLSDNFSLLINNYLVTLRKRNYEMGLE